MSYKKCKNDKYWCECNKKPCKKEPEVIYYECKESKNESKKCEKFIRQTHNLIEKLECKSEKLEGELDTASGNQALANQNLNDVKGDLAQIATKLGELQSDLNDVIGRINNDIIPRQANAAQAINDAIETQKAIDSIIDCLEDSFKHTVKCLKDNCSDGSCPILIPKKDCHHEWEDECDWEDKCDWKHDCDCKYEDEDDCDYEW